jgi:hypothetical protein
MLFWTDLKKGLSNTGTEIMVNRNTTMRFIFILSFTLLQGQSTWIQDISVSTKKNGVFIKVRSDKPLDSNQVTGWFNESSSWYYMTLHQTSGDTAQLESAPLAYPVNRIECMRAGESLQIGFRLAIPVEQFEFYHSSDPPELLASLRFPLTDVLASMAKEKQPLSPFQSSASIQKRPLWVKAVYFFGAGLTGAGFLAGDTQKGWEVPVGMGMIACAYVYQNFIATKKK